MTTRAKRVLVVFVGILAVAALAWQLPEIAAGGLLYPVRRDTIPPPPEGCADARFDSAGLELRGWRCPAAGGRRGTILYLHGIADNRSSSAGVIRRYVPRGWDVAAYDSRRHGASGGEVCTYGFHEKDDLRRIIDSLPQGPVVLFGTSLGAAIALQAAADEPRIALVIAAEVFSDLETVARERAPLVLPSWAIRRAFEIAQRRGSFKIDEVSPVTAAGRITAPVLLIHGADDRETPPAHSERVLAALKGPRRLLLIAGAGHNQSLNQAAAWEVIDDWIGRAAGGAR